MRTNIEVDHQLLAEAQAVTGAASMRTAIEAALRWVVLFHRQYRAGADLAGIGWEGDLDAMREDWSRDPWVREDGTCDG
jgi:Arc/MetJ family transcription regulator